MAIAASSDRFVTSLRKSGLVPLQTIDDILAGAPANADSDVLGKRFVSAGLLTAFQAKCLAMGKWRNLVVANKYKMLDHLGDGGMGQVYLAEHLLMKRKVALKVPPAKKLKDPGMVQRFIREARALASLDHPNIVRAHDLERMGDLYMLAMEYVDGPNLRDLVVEHGPRPVGQAAHYVAQAAQGLQHAHEGGWVHRDIKPANLLVDSSGVVKVLDLGLAFLLGDDADSPTRKFDENAVLGTADYLAPEQAINSHEVDIRADIYSLGATLYYLLTGRAMFENASIAQKLVSHQMKEPPSVRGLRPEVPQGLAQVLSKMTAKSPDDRYQTPGELAKALLPFASDADLVPPARSGVATPSRRISEATLASTISARSRSGNTTRRIVPELVGRAPPVKYLAAAAAVVVLLGMGGIFWSAFGGKSKAVAGPGPGLGVDPAAGGSSSVALAGERLVLRAHQGVAECVRILPDGRFITCGDDRAVRFWDANGKFLSQLDGHTDTVRMVTLVANDAGRLVSASRDGTVRLWDVPKGNELREFAGHGGQVWWADVSPDGRSVLTCGQDKTLRLWDINSGKELRTLFGHDEISTCALFLPDGRRAVSCSTDKTARLWDLQAGTEITSINLPDRAYRITLSFDGRQAIIGSHATVQAWDLVANTVRVYDSAAAPNAYIEQARLSPDGRWLLGGGSDGVVRLWSVASGRELPSIRGSRGKVLEVYWAPDGKSFAVSCGDGTVRVWDWTRLK